MNILMMGDSWGVPNYNPDYNVAPETHTEYVLRSLGYKVFNFSLNGGSLLDSIDYVKTALKKDLKNLHCRLAKKTLIYYKDGTTSPLPTPNYNGEKIDWIVWFHTESVREQLLEHMQYYVKLEEVHTFMSHMAYRAFKMLLKISGNPKTAVIGGQAPIDPILYEYVKPDFEIVDWRSELVGKPLPRCISFSRHGFVDRFYDSLEDKLKTLETHKIILDSMRDPNIFFDHCHPGPEPHMKLSKQLDKVFRGTEAQTVTAWDF